MNQSHLDLQDHISLLTSKCKQLENENIALRTMRRNEQEDGGAAAKLLDAYRLVTRDQLRGEK